MAGECDIQWPNISDIFQQVEKNEKGGISLKCLLCLPKTKIIKASVTSASNLRAHIKVTHPSKVSEFNDKMEKKGRKRKNECTDLAQPALKCAKQTHLGDNIPKSSDEQNQAVLRFIVGTGSPFSIVEHEDFLNLIKTCGGKNPPNRKQLMDKLEKSFMQMKNELISSLSEVSTVCATADCWTVFRRSYIGMTIHWLDPSTLERRSRGIACRRILGQHTYDVIADAIESILDDFEIKNKCSMMITDNGSNFLKAFRLFGGLGPDPDSCCEDTEEVDEIGIVAEPDTTTTAIAPILEDSDDYARLPPHHSCAAHTLNLLATTDAEAALCDSAYKKIQRLAFAKCQAIFNKQNKSALAADIVKKHLGRYFLVPGATRWNSQFDAIELLVKKEDKLDGLCKELDLPTFKRPHEIQFLAEYCKVMEPIAQGLDILQGDKEMYMGFLLPTLTVVKSTLTSLSELQWCDPLKQALLKGFEKRFSKYFENPDFEIGACLVPRFKLNWVPQMTERQSIRNALSAEFLKAAKKEPSATTKTAGNKAPQEYKNTKIDNFFSRITLEESNTDSFQIERAKAESELARYLHDTVDLKGMSDFCKQLFIKYNTAVPSSAHCERLFSAASLVITNRRGRISDTNFEMQLLLKFNKYLD